ncbi:unnamed protein product [Aphanomyces euteiches]
MAERSAAAVRCPLKQYVPLRATRHGSAPGCRPRMLTAAPKSPRGGQRPVKPPTVGEPSRPRTASGGSGHKKLQYALVCARLMAENQAFEMAQKRQQDAARVLHDKALKARCKSANGAVKQELKQRVVQPVRSSKADQTQPKPPPPSCNQRGHHAPPRSHFVPVEHQVVSMSAISKALTTIVRKPLNKHERNELCYALLDVDSIHSTSLDGYLLGKVVGVGTFGKVRIATHKVSAQVVAIKTYERSRTKDASQWKRIQHEAKLMEKLDHPYIIRLHETIETPTKLHIVMENVSSDVGNLCEFVKRHKRLSESDAGHVFIQIVSAVIHMHSMHVIHRDIKLENILLDRYGNTKLVDFGFSAVQSATKPFSTFCGTPCYMAPEIIHRKTYWGQPVDVWSLGVLLFAMLCGFFPFRARNYNDLYRKILKGHFDFPPHVSHDAQTLIRGMLEADPTKRLKLHDVRAHAWTRQFRAMKHQHLPLYRQLSLGLLADSIAAVLQRHLFEHMEMLGIHRNVVQTALDEKRYNGLSTLYYLLLHRAEVLCHGGDSSEEMIVSAEPPPQVLEADPRPTKKTTVVQASPPPSPDATSWSSHVQNEPHSESSLSGAEPDLETLARLNDDDMLDSKLVPWQSRELRDVVEMLDSEM